MTDRIPAEAWPVGHFLQDEMDARGWSVGDVASRMASGYHARAVWTLTMELLLHCSDTDMTIAGETADALGRAFGTSPELWINLNASYQKWRKGRANFISARQSQEKPMSYIQRELDKISAQLHETPRDTEKYQELYIAQQALSWALEPTGFRSPWNTINEILTEPATGAPIA